MNVNVEVTLKMSVTVDRNVMLNVLVHVRQSRIIKFS